MNWLPTKLSANCKLYIFKKDRKFFILKQTIEQVNQRYISFLNFKYEKTLIMLYFNTVGMKFDSS